MAEVTAFRNNALPYPVYGVPYVIEFPIVDADGAGIASATGLDSELVKNGNALTDATNEATEIGGGWYYLILTAAEMTADSLSIEVRSSSTGAQTVRIKLAPRKLVALRSGTAAGGAGGNIVLDASAGAKDDIWNGCLCVATIDGNVEARIIDNYTGSSQTADVTPDWNVTPDSDDTFVIYLPEGRQIPEANITAVNSASATAADLDTNLTEILDRLGYLLARDTGAVPDAQTAAPVYTITRSGDTYTVTLAGCTSAGIRTAPTLVKT